MTYNVFGGTSTLLPLNNTTHTHYFNGYFPGYPELAGFVFDFLLHLFEPVHPFWTLNILHTAVYLDHVQCLIQSTSQRHTYAQWVQNVSVCPF